MRNSRSRPTAILAGRQATSRVQARIVALFKRNTFSPPRSVSISLTLSSGSVVGWPATARSSEKLGACLKHIRRMYVVLYIYAYARLALASCVRPSVRPSVFVRCSRKLHLTFAVGAMLSSPPSLRRRPTDRPIGSLNPVRPSACVCSLSRRSSTFSYKERTNLFRSL